MSVKTYRIGEAAELLNLKSYVLRFWETEFSQLAPLRTDKGQRLYSEEDLHMLMRIKYLLHERGMTIEGAKRALAEQAATGSTTGPTTGSTTGFFDRGRGIPAFAPNKEFAPDSAIAPGRDSTIALGPENVTSNALENTESPPEISPGILLAQSRLKAHMEQTITLMSKMRQPEAVPFSQSNFISATKPCQKSPIESAQITASPSKELIEELLAELEELRRTLKPKP